VAYQFIKRLLILFATLLLVAGVIFFVLQVIPGDPAQIILGIQATPENLQALRHKLGLDLPLPVQYWKLDERNPAGRLWQVHHLRYTD